MKKKLLLTFLCAIFAFTSPAYAEWVDTEFSDDTVKAIYVDTDIKDMETYCIIKSKTIFREPHKFMNHNFTIMQEVNGYYLHTVDGVKTVQTNRYFPIEAKVYDANGKYLTGYRAKYRHTYNIEPRSINEMYALWAKRLYLESTNQYRALLDDSLPQGFYVFLGALILVIVLLFKKRYKSENKAS